MRCEHSLSGTVYGFLHTGSGTVRRGAAVQCSAYGKLQCESSDGGWVAPYRAVRVKLLFGG